MHAASLSQATKICIWVASVVMYAATTGSSKAEDQATLSAELKQATQAFSDASQSGDVALLARYLDADVVFTNETGEVATRQEVLDGTSAPPAGAPHRRSEILDWTLHEQGADLATAAFVDRVTAELSGQTLSLTFRSTETWAKRQDGWKIVASHTMNMPRPPPAIALPAAVLADYVGTYRLGTLYTVTIASSGEGLTASVNGGSPVKLQVEVKDVLFTSSVPNARRIFQRDTGGRVMGYIMRRDGADLSFRKTK